MEFMQCSDDEAWALIFVVNAKLPGRRTQAESVAHLPVDHPLHEPVINIVPALENILTYYNE